MSWICTICSTNNPDDADVCFVCDAEKPLELGGEKSVCTLTAKRAEALPPLVDGELIIPSEYMISRMIKEDMLEKLDFSNIPNTSKLSDSFKTLDYDPTGEYSVPYFWGTVGIIYNSKYVTKTVDSWDILWDEDYKDKILMFDNSRDAFGIALKRLGYSMNTTDLSQIDQAAASLKEQAQVVQAYVMDQIFDKMISEEAYIAPYYAGDFITMVQDNPDLRFVIPKEGTNLFTDAMCIPKGAKHKTEAEMFINFMCETNVGYSNAMAVGYSTPLSEVYDMILADEEFKEFLPICYPSDDVLSNTEVFIHLPDDVLSYTQKHWIDICF
jgi:spermidine/putrescine transport system substrate-binding protein